jgi:tetratricopeptide (TPR) repeat protein
MARLYVIFVGCFAALSLGANSALDSITEAGVEEFEAAYEAWDAARFAAAAELFRRACTATPANPTNFYWLGTAHFHLMLQLESAPKSRTNETAAKAAFDGALAAHSTAVKLDESQAESHAMLGTLSGMKIKGNLIRAARYGPRTVRHREMALKHGASNPRVQYLLGTGRFYTAKKRSEWGDALRIFQTAEMLFQAEATKVAAPLEPRWGYGTCLTFIGRTYELLGQREAAAGYFRKALARHPADRVAKIGLARVTDGN